MRVDEVTEKRYQYKGIVKAWHQSYVSGDYSPLKCAITTDKGRVFEYDRCPRAIENALMFDDNRPSVKEAPISFTADKYGRNIRNVIRTD